MSFSDRLLEGMERKQSVVCVGLDPVIDRIPGEIRDRADSEFGPGVEANAFALGEFCCQIIDAVSDVVAVCKMQVAFFERYGSYGWKALERVVRYAQERELIVIGDCKRGDIGSTAQAYADGLFGFLGVDAVTLSPYLGPESLQPFIDRCPEKGIFVLVRTSNPGADTVQEIRDERGVSVSDRVASMVVELGADSKGRFGYGCVGAVVAGNVKGAGKHFRGKMPGVLFLVPGYGAQGGTANEIKDMMEDGRGVVVNASRSLIYAGEKMGGDFAVVCRKATEEMVRDLRG